MRGSFFARLICSPSVPSGRRRSLPKPIPPPEALALSLAEKGQVDLAYMVQLTGKEVEEITVTLTGVIFLDPLKKEWQTKASAFEVQPSQSEVFFRRHDPLGPSAEDRVL